MNRALDPLIPGEAIIDGLSGLAAGYLLDMARKHDDAEVNRMLRGFGRVIHDGEVLDVLVALSLVVGKIIETAPSDVDGTACLDAFIAALRFTALTRRETHG
jgi:hypothetical protein